MRDPRLQKRDARAWALARRQHAVVAHGQLIELGFTPKAIKHRVRTGRLHPKRRGVYAVGRPELTRRGEWLAAVLSCGPDAALSHRTAAALWDLRPEDGPIELVVPASTVRRQAGIRVHRGRRELTRHDGIPVTTPVWTLVDLATTLTDDDLEAAVNRADKLDLIDPSVCGTRSTSSAGSAASPGCGGSWTAAPSPSPTPRWSGASCRSRAPPGYRSRTPACA